MVISNACCHSGCTGVSISIPRKVRRVIGASIFDGFTGRVGQYYDIIVYRDIEVSR